MPAKTNAHHEPLMGTDKASAYLAVHPKTLQRMARCGEIRAMRDGRRYKFRQAWLDSYIDEHSARS